MEIIPVLHNVSSVQRLVDSARIAYALDYKTFIATKVYGGAAQSGVGEAMRLALKLNRSFIVLPDLKDAIDLFTPERVLLVTHAYAKRLVRPDTDFLGEAASLGRILLVVSGTEPEFSPGELKLGEPLYLEGVNQRLGPAGELSLLLYYLKR